MCVALFVVVVAIIFIIMTIIGLRVRCKLVALFMLVSRSFFLFLCVFV